MIKLDDVLNSKIIKIYQNDDYFKFSLDGVLLANFVDIKLASKKILDIGTGTGIIPLLLSKRTNKKIEAIEIQKELCEMFLSTIQYNKLSNQIVLINDDIKIYAKLNENVNQYDILVCNPPYYNGHCDNLIKTKQRHQDTLDLEELFKSSKRLLKDGGSLFLVYDSMEFSRVMNTLNNCSFSVKKIQFVYYNKKKNSSIFLIECVKNGNTQTIVLPPLILYDEYNRKTKDYQNIFSELEGEKDEPTKL